MDSERTRSVFQHSDSHVPNISNCASEFHALISTRKDERKEKARENIRKTRTILENTIARHEGEAQTKLFGLPDPVWSMEILPHIENPMDLGRMWGVHPKFREFSGKPSTNEVLLSKVLSIESVLPHLANRLITCRQLSSGMRNSIDGIFEKNFTKVLRSPNFLDYTAEICVGDQPLFWQLDRMLAAFDEGAGDRCAERFFGHSLDVYWIPDGDMTEESIPELKRRTRLLLERLGDQIWHFRLYVDQFFFQPEEVYHYLLLWFSYMPNLKWVELDVTTRDKIDPSIIENHPMPRVNDLERLTVTLHMSNPVQVLCTLATGIMQANRETIRALDFYDARHCGNSYQERVVPFFNGMIPVLSTMKLDMLNGANIIQILYPVASSNWNLTKLNQSFDGLGRSPSFQTIFNIMNSFPNLELLHLRDVKNIVMGKAVPSVRLPNLVDFKLTFDISAVAYGNVEKILFFTSLLFLVQSKKLKTLDWSWTFSAPEPDSVKNFKDFLIENGEKEVIGFKCGLQAKLSLSNLWDVFPALELLKTKDGDGKSLVIRKPRPEMM